LKTPYWILGRYTKGRKEKLIRITKNEKAMWNWVQGVKGFSRFAYQVTNNFYIGGPGV